MSIAPVGSPTTSPYALGTYPATPASHSAPPVKAAGVDADGDHDGSKGGTIDVRA